MSAVVEVVARQCCLFVGAAAETTSLLILTCDEVLEPAVIPQQVFDVVAEVVVKRTG